jgi:hypothetical protein
MGNPERFQNIVLAVKRLAMHMKSLNITTEEGGGFSHTERNRRQLSRRLR